MKNRKLPEIIRGGKTFIVDVAFAEIVQKGRPEHYLSLLDMIDMGDHYKFDHDNPPRILEEIFKHEKDWLDITIPHMCEMDPEGVAIKYGLKVDALPKKDSQLTCSSVRIRERLVQGKLPIIKIRSEEYFVDWRMQELRLTTDFSKNIDLSQLPTTLKGDKFLMFYDIQSKKEVKIPDDVTALPKNVVLVVIQSELWLDPISAARQLDLNPLTFVDRYPLQFNLTARTYPISQSWIPYLIKENLKDAAALKQKPEPIKQNIKPKRRKGKSL